MIKWGQLGQAFPFTPPQYHENLFLTNVIRMAPIITLNKELNAGKINN